MRIASLTSLVLGLQLSGCGLSPEVVLLGPPGREYDPVPREDVWVFSSQERVLVKHQPIARISVRQEYWPEGLPPDENLLYQLRSEAGKVGAHAVILGDVEGTSRIGGVEVPIGWMAATAVRFLGPDLQESVDPVRSPRDMRAIAVAPLAIPEDLSVPDSVVDGFVQDVYAELEAGGFRPLPFEAWGEAWARANPEREEVLDPKTGLKTENSGDPPEQRVLRILAEDHGADGFLFPEIIGVEAPFVGDEARWDGVDQKVGKTRSTGAKILSGIANLLLHGEGDLEEPDPEGFVWALSLAVEIDNVIGARVYSGRGGIELLEGADFEGGIYIGDPEPEDYEVVEIPDEMLFQKRNRFRRAVRIALGPLVRG